MSDHGCVPMPQTRPLTDTDGFRWTVTIDRGCLLLTGPEGRVIRFERPEELRALAPQLVRAVTEHTLDVQENAAKTRARKRLARKRLGLPIGLAHQPFTDPSEPALALDEAIA